MRKIALIPLIMLLTSTPIVLAQTQTDLLGYTWNISEQGIFQKDEWSNTITQQTELYCLKNMTITFQNLQNLKMKVTVVNLVNNEKISFWEYEKQEVDLLRALTVEIGCENST